MLRQSEALAPLAAIAVQHRERLDGSGYPRGLSGAGISREARILAAADAYQAMREPRPHRPELSAEEAAGELRADVRAGRHDADAVASDSANPNRAPASAASSGSPASTRASAGSASITASKLRRCRERDP